MKKCPYCGKENDDQRKTCEHCFASLHIEEENRPLRVGKKLSTKEVEQDGT